MDVLTKLFWLDCIERAVKTACQVALSALGLDTVDILRVDWVQLASLSAGAALISVLTSVASAPRVGTLSPASAVKKP